MVVRQPHALTRPHHASERLAAERGGVVVERRQVNVVARGAHVSDHQRLWQHKAWEATNQVAGIVGMLAHEELWKHILTRELRTPRPAIRTDLRTHHAERATGRAALRQSLA